jgi:hypothetical protein
MLAAEPPSLPEDVVVAVRAHFNDLTDWLARILAPGLRQGSVCLDGKPDQESGAFPSAIYGGCCRAGVWQAGTVITITEMLPARVVRLHQASRPRASTLRILKLGGDAKPSSVGRSFRHFLSAGPEQEEQKGEEAGRHRDRQGLGAEQVHQVADRR